MGFAGCGLMSYGFLQRWRPSTLSPIVAVSHGPPRRTFGYGDIKRGWLVEDSDGVRSGRVARSSEAVLVVARGLLWARLHVWTSAVAEIHEGVVRLNVTLGWVEAHGWDRPPDRRER